MSLLKAALGYAATAYLSDTLVKPRHLGRMAREHCDRVHKPLLFIHDGGVAHHLFGAPVKVDASRRTAYPVRVPDQTFGAVLAVGVLECLKRPDRALTEWRRVAQRVFVAVPSWYSFHTWLHPEHRWFIDSSLQRARALPLWSNRRGIYLLQVSDKRYGKQQCIQATPRTRSPTTTVSKPNPSPSTPRPSLPSPSPSPSPSPPSGPPSPYGDLAPCETELVLDSALPDLSEVKSLGSDPAASAPSASSRSVSDLMVISGPRSEKS